MGVQTLTLNYVVAVIVTLIISMTIHEFMHSFVGYKLGDYTAKAEGRLSLNPLALSSVPLPVMGKRYWDAWLSSVQREWIISTPSPPCPISHGFSISY